MVVGTYQTLTTNLLINHIKFQWSIANNLQIAAENVGQRNFTLRIEYFGNEEKNVLMAPGDHTNHECLCVPMDMYVDYEVSFFYLLSYCG